jgi:hypothetical protein
MCCFLDQNGIAKFMRAVAACVQFGADAAESCFVGEGAEQFVTTGPDS